MHLFTVFIIFIHSKVKTAGAQGWFNVQSYFSPVSNAETSPEQKGLSHGSLADTSEVNVTPQSDLEEWNWDHEKFLNEPETKQKETKTKTVDHEGWDDAEWGEASTWSNEGWSNSPTTDTKSKRTGKKGD